MRRLFILLLCAAMLLTLASCGGKSDTPQGTQPAGHVHNWEDATCVTPRFCPGCGEIEGEPLGHDMLPATVDAPSTCSRCGLTVGAPLVSVSYSLENGILIISGAGRMEYCYDDYYEAPWRERGFEIKEVVIGSGVTTIGSASFQYCVNLTGISIPDSVTKIGASAFFRCSRLMYITIPDSVTDIDRSAFAYCDSLTNITIPSGVTNIGEGAFESCTSLEDIVVESGEPYYTSIDGVLFNGHMTLLHTYPAGKNSEEYVIPDGVKKIEDRAFASCSYLTSITIPDSVTSIGGYAFCGCTGLTSITIPPGVMWIDDYTFYGCTGLTSITIPSGVMEVGHSVLNGCVSLTSITIPSSMRRIDSDIFSECVSLTDIYYEGTAAEWSLLLSNVEIPETVTVHYGHTA